MVKDIKCFGPKLQIAFAEDFEVLQQRGIEVGATWIVDGVAAAAAKRQSARRYVGIRILKQGSEGLPDSSPVISNVLVGTADAIGVRSSSEIVGDTAIIRNAYAAWASAVYDAEGRTRLVDDDAGKLPLVKQQPCHGGVPHT